MTTKPVRALITHEQLRQPLVAVCAQGVQVHVAGARARVLRRGRSM